VAARVVKADAGTEQRATGDERRRGGDQREQDERLMRAEDGERLAGKLEPARDPSAHDRDGGSLPGG
jgi:hypothetical protein